MSQVKAFEKPLHPTDAMEESFYQEHIKVYPAAVNGTFRRIKWTILTIWLGLLVPLVWSFAPLLDVLRLGEPSATGLGVRVPVAAFVLLALAVAICASCIALAGGLLFLGLLAPHIARRLVGSGSSAVLPAAGLVGATLLLLADALAARLLPASEIPAGVMVTALGAPYFLYLLRRR